jgi:hypothetical protein
MQKTRSRNGQRVLVLVFHVLAETLLTRLGPVRNLRVGFHTFRVQSCFGCNFAHLQTYHMTRNFTAAANKCEGHTHVLLITTGSVASVKAPLIVEELLKVSYHARPLAPLANCLLTTYAFPSPAPIPCPTSLCCAVLRAPLLAQGRISPSGSDQAITHLFPTGRHTQAWSQRLDG